jgi:predicted RNA-binding protein Jag
VNDIGQADVLVTLRTYYRKRQRPIMDAENRGMPIYVLRSNTVNQMQRFLADLFNVAAEAVDGKGEKYIRQETMAAINAVLNGESWVELPPASASIRRQQHQMARQAKLVSHSYGKEPRRRVRIYRE